MPYLLDANVFALASENEGLPDVIIEAMACGLPIVTTDAGGCRDAVVEAETGYVVPIDDRRALADRLSRLSNGALRSEMGRRSRERAVDEYSIQAFADRFEAILSGVR